MSENGVVGLINLGNTCYANSVLQALRSIPAFSSLILSKKLQINERAPDALKEFYESFHNLVKQLWKNSRGTIVRPVNFLKSTAQLVQGTIYEDFARNMPNDAHEYYTFLIDKLQQATYTPAPTPESTSDAETAWQQSFKKDYSKFVPFFYGQIKKTLICHKCKTENATYEIFNSLKINLKDDNLPLIQSISDNFKDEEIDEYRCDTCKSLEKATIQQKIIKTPPYLSITINRFADGYGQGRKDVRTFTLDNNELLDLSSIISDNIDKQYSLISTIDHHGSMRGGHYVCSIKHVPSDVPANMTTDGPKAGQWYLYDDDTINEINSPMLSQSTYMLFLRRI